MHKKLTEYDFPKDLKEMDTNELDLLSYSIRDFLIEQIAKTGGHLASNLGIVELTIALHKVFDSPKDKIIWDVGHQSYVHKILTGRADAFDGLRQLDGMSGFPKGNESDHDAFDTGHSSTSISIAAGIAAAKEIQGEKSNVVAVIGDGSLTGGLAYEALNNVGASKSKVMVILNDNGMSISKNIGGVSQHLGKLRTSRGYLRLKKSLKRTLSQIPVIGDDVSTGLGHFKDRMKYALLSGGVIFEELGFKYIGPINGHKINELLEALQTANQVNGPVLIHVITRKGKGYRNAELNPNKFHGIGSFDPETGKVLGGSGTSYSSVFGQAAVNLAKEDDRIVAISAAMCDATGLGEFASTYPKRFFDVGIAEAHGVTFAAGLAKSGLRPLVAIYSSFLQRGYDQIVEDVCIQNLPVVFAIDRAGIVGADGETHHGIFDLSYLSHMPNMTVLTPCDGKQLEDMLAYAFTLNSPVAIRYPRGSCALEEHPNKKFSGSNLRLEQGLHLDIWAVGKMVSTAEKIRGILWEEGIDAGIVDVTTVKPLDLSLINQDTSLIVTLEDNVISGGFGEKLKASVDHAKVLIFGWPDQFIEHGECDQLFARYGLDAETVSERIREELEGKA
ncbi:1-deoxy-D-xylulose-5-phosphate synthase [Clostridiales Family XIII bacterium PM5-7]